MAVDQTIGVNIHDPLSCLDRQPLTIRRKDRLTDICHRAAATERLTAAQLMVFTFIALKMIRYCRIADRLSLNWIANASPHLGDVRSLRRILDRLEEAQLLVRVRGCGRGQYTVFALHPRLTALVLPQCDVPRTVLPPAAIADQPISADPVAVVVAEPTEPRTGRQRPVTPQSASQVAMVLQELPAAMQPRTGKHHAAASRLVRVALDRGYSIQQVTAAVQYRVPRGLVFNPPGFLAARLEALYITQQPSRVTEEARSRAVAQQRAESAEADADLARQQCASANLWSRISDRVLGQLLGAAARHRGTVFSNPKIAVRALSAELQSVLSAAADADSAVTAWVAEWAHPDTPSASDEKVTQARAVFAAEPVKGGPYQPPFSAATPYIDIYIGNTSTSHSSNLTDRNPINTATMGDSR